MNAFKILSRSTSLSTRRQGSVPTQRTPSSGEAENPQLFRQDEKSSAASAAFGPVRQSSRKRKRGDTESSRPDLVPENLDFFGCSRQKLQNGETDSLSQPLSQKEKVHDEDTESFVLATEPQLMTEEQCRQILRAHKVKITRLHVRIDPIEEEKLSAIPKKRRQAKERLQKETSKKQKDKLHLVPQPLTDFSELRSRYKISKRLADNIDLQGYKIPTEVQLGSLPLLLDLPRGALGGVINQSNRGPDSRDLPEEYGPKIDLMTVAPTGSGKTLAFLIPMLNAIIQQRRVDKGMQLPKRDRKRQYQGPQAVILAPTKELASQIVNEAKKLALQTGVKISMVRKGMEVAPKVEDATTTDHMNDEDSNGSEIESDEEVSSRNATSIVKADILVATPLSLLHSLVGSQSLPSVKYLVLDEADVLLDPLFRIQTQGVWNVCIHTELRVSLWSATMGSSIEELAKTIMAERHESLTDSVAEQRPKRTTYGKAELVRLVVGLKDSAVPNIHHRLTFASTEQGKLLAVRDMIRPALTAAAGSPAVRPPFLIFTQTISRAIALHAELIYDIPPEAGGSSRIAVLHSDLSDTARDWVMTKFRKGVIWVLITTDLLSRGVDFPGVNAVVNYDIPNSSAAYVHRVGRTGRAGREGGIAVTLYTKEDIALLKNIANVIAASERQRTSDEGGRGVQKWLLDALPKPSKKEKQQLKKRGVEVRRDGKGDGKAKMQARISTKSGYERKLENKKRDWKRRARGAGDASGRGNSTTTMIDDFTGFDD